MISLLQRAKKVIKVKNLLPMNRRKSLLRIFTHTGKRKSNESKSGEKAAARISLMELMLIL